MGLSLKDLIERHLAQPSYVAGFLVVTGLLLAMTLLRKNADRAVELTVATALILGVVQGCAILPGISRSGSTIAVALVMGIAGKDAARFSFLMALPAIAGATLLSLMKLEESQLSLIVVVIGLLSAGVSGWIALKWFIPLVEKGKLHVFAPYVWLLAIGTWLWMS